MRAWWMGPLMTAACVKSPEVIQIISNTAPSEDVAGYYTLPRMEVRLNAEVKRIVREPGACTKELLDVHEQIGMPKADAITAICSFTDNPKDCAKKLAQDGIVPALNEEISEYSIDKWTTSTATIPDPDERYAVLMPGGPGSRSLSLALKADGRLGSADSSTSDWVLPAVSSAVSLATAWAPLALGGLGGTMSGVTDKSPTMSTLFAGSKASKDCQIAGAAMLASVEMRNDVLRALGDAGEGAVVDKSLAAAEGLVKERLAAFVGTKTEKAGPIACAFDPTLQALADAIPVLTYDPKAGVQRGTPCQVPTFAYSSVTVSPRGAGTSMCTGYSHPALPPREVTMAFKARSPKLVTNGAAGAHSYAYRVPVMATASIVEEIARYTPPPQGQTAKQCTTDLVVHRNDDLIVPQFGSVAFVPRVPALGTTEMHVELDPATGALIAIKSSSTGVDWEKLTATGSEAAALAATYEDAKETTKLEAMEDLRAQLEAEAAILKLEKEIAELKAGSTEDIGSP